MMRRAQKKTLLFCLFVPFRYITECVQWFGHSCIGTDTYKLHCAPSRCQFNVCFVLSLFFGRVFVCFIFAHAIAMSVHYVNINNYPSRFQPSSRFVPHSLRLSCENLTFPLSKFTLDFSYEWIVGTSYGAKELSTIWDTLSHLLNVAFSWLYANCLAQKMMRSFQILTGNIQDFEFEGKKNWTSEAVELQNQMIDKIQKWWIYFPGTMCLEGHFMWLMSITSMVLLDISANYARTRKTFHFCELINTRWRDHVGILRVCFEKLWL